MNRVKILWAIEVVDECGRWRYIYKHGNNKTSRVYRTKADTLKRIGEVWPQWKRRYQGVIIKPVKFMRVGVE